MPEELSEFNKNLKTAMGVREKNPRLSVNKLAEYMIADPLRRRQIVKDAKHQKPFKTGLYNESRSAITQYLGSHCDENGVLATIENLQNKEIRSDWQKDDRDNSILSLEMMLDTELPDLSDYDIQYNEENPLVRLAGLDISVFPAVILTHKKTSKTGGIKVHISKGNELKEPALEYVSTMVKVFFIESGIKENKIDDNSCISIDVFRKAYKVAPKSYKRTLGKIEAACEEICMRWERI